MRANSELKIHFLNVNHGDATIIEFPDIAGENIAHFAVIDTGPDRTITREYVTEYFRALKNLRQYNDADDQFDYRIHFVCMTHPHSDHYGGAENFLDNFGNPQNPATNKIERFWDCGFRINDDDYLAILQRIINNNRITFTRVSAGTEFKIGECIVQVLAPSIDLRNRYDTYGVKTNDASIVLRIKFRSAYIIMAGDAEYASWAKLTEEFPRKEAITFYHDAIGLAERDETTDQLDCMLLRMSHHGSKRGTSFEYLERLSPGKVVISAGDDNYYVNNEPASWRYKFPDPIIISSLGVLPNPVTFNANNRYNDIFVTGDHGHIIFKFTGSDRFRTPMVIASNPGDPNFADELYQCWRN